MYMYWTSREARSPCLSREMRGGLSTAKPRGYPVLSLLFATATSTAVPVHLCSSFVSVPGLAALGCKPYTSTVEPFSDANVL
jgi:hypothetical protein